MRRLTIQAAVSIVPPHAVVLQDVQHPGHLTEDEHTRTWEENTTVVVFNVQKILLKLNTK